LAREGVPDPNGPPDIGQVFWAIVIALAFVFSIVMYFWY